MYAGSQKTPIQEGTISTVKMKMDTHACMFSCSGFAAILAQSVLAWAEVPPSVVAWRAWADVWSSPPLGGSIAWFPNNSGTQGNGCISTSTSTGTSTVYCLV